MKLSDIVFSPETQLAKKEVLQVLLLLRVFRKDLLNLLEEGQLELLGLVEGLL